MRFKLRNRVWSLDLKAPAAKDVLVCLVNWANVVVTHFPPKVKETLGLSYETFAALNPRLIYADMTGYGFKLEQHLATRLLTRTTRRIARRPQVGDTSSSASRFSKP